jgi:hypothetical protein
LFFPNFFLDNGLFFPNYPCFHIERQPQHGFPMMLVINQTRQRALLATIACVPSPRIGLVDGLTTEIRALCHLWCSRKVNFSRCWSPTVSYKDYAH